MKYGKVVFDDLKRFQKDLEKIRSEIPAFMEECAKELAARLLRKAIKRTRTGVYPKASGKTGGTLKRGWSIGEMNFDASRGLYRVEIINPVYYGIYVEYGHRTRNHKSWVKGRFMLTISEDEIREITPALLERKLKKKLQEALTK